MARTLRYLGVLVLAGAAWFVLAGAFGWIPAEIADRWIVPTVYAGVFCVAVGVLLGILSPVSRRLLRTKCVRCGVPIEKGQTYCLDHLQETLNEYRDRQRRTAMDPPGGAS